MAYKTYRILLSEADRTRLTDLVRCGAAPAAAQTHARILLMADQSPDGPAWIDRAICTALTISPRTAIRVRRAWGIDGFDAAIFRRRPTATRPRRLDGRQEAHLLAISCSTPPPGFQRWTFRMLANKAVELEIVDGIAPNTVRTLLKKTSSNPG